MNSGRSLADRPSFFALQQRRGPLAVAHRSRGILESMPFATARDGARIYFRVSGPTRAQPLVLIMGLGWDMSGWKLLLPHLTGYRLLLIDNRGTGRSDKPDAPYTIKQM